MTMINGERSLATHGFIRRHWLGEYSLPRSFWLHTILLSWFVPIVTLAFVSSNSWYVPARGSSVVFVAILLMFFPLLLWGVVGTIRVCALHEEKGERKTSATAARLVIAFLFVDSLGFLFNTRAIVIEHIHMAFTGKYGAPASISVVNNGTELLITGELRQGSAKAFKLAINRSPSVTTIALDSKGGLVAEAETIVEAISQHGLDTYVRRECSSACTLVFLAGKRRCAAEGAKIGFHAASYARDLSWKSFQEVVDYERDLYVKAGLSESFVSEILETPNSRVWYPSREELLEARVTTSDCQ